jgi:hypothetical protein
MIVPGEVVLYPKTSTLLPQVNPAVSPLNTSKWRHWFDQLIEEIKSHKLSLLSSSSALYSAWNKEKTVLCTIKQRQNKWRTHKHSVRWNENKERQSQQHGQEHLSSRCLGEWIYTVLQQSSSLPTFHETSHAQCSYQWSPKHYIREHFMLCKIIQSVWTSRFKRVMRTVTLSSCHLFEHLYFIQVNWVCITNCHTYCPSMLVLISKRFDLCFTTNQISLCLKIYLWEQSPISSSLCISLSVYVCLPLFEREKVRESHHIVSARKSAHGVKVPTHGRTNCQISFDTSFDRDPMSVDRD